MIVATAYSAITSVNDSNSNQTLLTANTARKGFIIANNSSAILYIKFGTTASTTDFTIAIAANGSFTHLGPVVYVGRVDGIWASDSTGAALITELT